MNRRDGYLFRVLQNSKITYRSHRSFQGGEAFYMLNFLKPNNNETYNND